MTKKLITGPKRKRLQEIILDLIRLEKMKAEAEISISDLKSEVIEINSKYDFPEISGKSQSFDSIRVTYPESGYDVDFHKFIEIFGWSIFKECFEVTKAEMNMESWNLLLGQERVTEEGLAKCIFKRKTLSPKVGIVK